MKGSEIICESLLREGVDALFGHPGGAILPFYDALWSYPQLRHVLVRHEQSAAHAADGYARMTGKPGVCVATSGPGATNLITGIMGAKADSVPLVAITGQVARAALGTEAFQECDICSIAAVCTKRTYLVMSAGDLARTIRDAFRVAQEGRPGPVLIDVPRDVQLEEAEFEYPDPPPATELPLSDETMENVRKAAELMNQAERPVIIAGHGIINSRAFDELLALVEGSGIPVINTLLGLSGFPRNHPQSLGMLGMHGMYWCNMVVDQADVVIGLGMRFDDRVTGRVSGFAPHARIVHLDIEASQVGRIVPAEVPLVGDARPILKALAPLVQKSDALLPQQVLTEMNAMVQADDDAVVVTGVGQHQMWAAQYLFLNQPNSFVTSGGLGAMGFELPAALGAQLGRPGATVWSVAGDGGFQMTLQELITAVEEKLPIKIALFNNGYLGMVRQWQEMFFDGHLKEVPMPGPDYVKLANAYGIPALRVEHQEDVAAALQEAKAYDGPFLIEFVVERDTNVFPMVPPGGSLADTMEDPRTMAAAR
ncbi:Acetolactate synthase large subunit [Geodia barretti]|uniref:2-hydroxyacyl-CoA lyase 2 n=1 Tax=Geodia barretti TaxID=519541 RepID=A0AA35S157_GEOBA|nr:Acetolactate synthase large subunit [Geodia barretti]